MSRPEGGGGVVRVRFLEFFIDCVASYDLTRRLALWSGSIEVLEEAWLPLNSFSSELKNGSSELTLYNDGYISLIIGKKGIDVRYQFDQEGS